MTYGHLRADCLYTTDRHTCNFHVGLKLCDPCLSERFVCPNMAACRCTESTINIVYTVLSCVIDCFTAVCRWLNKDGFTFTSPPVLPPGESFGVNALLTMHRTAHYEQTFRHPQNRNYNVLHRHQRRTEPRPRLTCSENFVKFGHGVFEICERTDRHTYRHAHRNTSHPAVAEVIFT